MKIKSLLTFIIIATVALFAISIGSLIYLVNNIQSQKEAFETKETILLLEADLLTVSDQLTSDARAYVNTGNNSFYNNYQTEVNETQTYNKIISEFEAILPPAIAEIAQTVQSESGKLGQMEAEAFALVEQNEHESATDLIYSDAYYAGKDVINNNLEQFDQEVKNWIDGIVAATESKVTLSISLLIISLIIFFIFNVAGVYVLIRKMKPLYTLTEQANELAAGNLTISKLDVPERAKDEISQLTKSFNAMFDSLHGINTTVSKSSIELSASSEELVANAAQSSDAIQKVTHSIEGVAEGASEQLGAIQESAQAMTEVATGIQHIASTASDVAVASELASTRAQDGGNRLNEAVSQMKQIESVVNEAMGSIQQLSARSKEIENIVDAITEIADQTNLLALNAAIEAARAGDAGKGFAVVADEVKKLAEESNNSAQKIATIIHSIQSETNTTVDKMNQVNETVLSGVETMSVTGESFKEIISSSQDVTDQIQEVSAVSEQIAASAQQVSATFETIEGISTQSVQATNQVAGLSQEQLAATEEITSATNLLNDLASELNQEVTKFKL